MWLGTKYPVRILVIFVNCDKDKMTRKNYFLMKSTLSTYVILDIQFSLTKIGGKKGRANFAPNLQSMIMVAKNCSNSH